MSVSTKVVDSVYGRPASGVRVKLCRRGCDGWTASSSGTTGPDGRLTMSIHHRGAYRLTFDTNRYFAELGQQTVHPSVTVEFTLTDPAEHCEIVLLTTPHSYTTYKSS